MNERKKTSMWISIVALIAIGVWISTIIEKMGGTVSDEDIAKYSTSQNYDINKKEFKNQHESSPMKVNNEPIIKRLYQFITSQCNSKPENGLDYTTPDLEAFTSYKKGIHTIWFGHSTLLLNIDGQIILTDPVFSKSASPVSFMVKRFQKPVLPLDDLPEVDIILLSHDHYDHLDMKTIKHFRSKKTKFITPLGVGVHLRKWGIQNDRITELDWWDAIKADNLEFIATPTQHFSGRSFRRPNQTLWASWVIKSENSKVFFNGDGGYNDHFKQINQKHGPFNLAFIEAGQYNEEWSNIHLMPFQWKDVFNDMTSEYYFPIHNSMFYLSPHKNWYDPIDEFKASAKQNNVDAIFPNIGEISSIQTEDIVD